MEGFLNPIEVLKQLRLRKDMVAADFGSGSGSWVITLAKKLIAGKVYAIDILSQPLSALKGKAKLEKIFNIETIQSDLEGKNGSRLPENSCDLVLMTNLLFQVEDKISLMNEGKRALRKGGKILIVDWKKEVPLGPVKGRVSAKEVKKITEKLGFKFEKEFEAGACHWGLIVVK